MHRQLAKQVVIDNATPHITDMYVQPFPQIIHAVPVACLAFAICSARLRFFSSSSDKGGPYCIGS